MTSKEEKIATSETMEQEVSVSSSSASVNHPLKPTLSIEIDEEDDEDYNDNNEEGQTPGSTVGALTPHGSLSSRGKWTSAEDEILKNAVETHDGKNWKKISDMLEGRTDVQCLHRWQKVLRPGLIKGPWTKEVKIRDEE